jgi:hypothetical protein
MSLDLNNNPEYKHFKEMLAQLVSALDDPKYTEFEALAKELTDEQMLRIFYHKVSHQVLGAITVDPYSEPILLYDLNMFMMFLRERYEGIHSTGE